MLPAAGSKAGTGNRHTAVCKGDKKGLWGKGFVWWSECVCQAGSTQGNLERAWQWPAARSAPRRAAPARFPQPAVSSAAGPGSENGCKERKRYLFPPLRLSPAQGVEEQPAPCWGRCRTERRCPVLPSYPSELPKWETGRAGMSSRPWRQGMGTGPLFPLPALFPSSPIDKAPCGQTATDPPQNSPFSLIKQLFPSHPRVDVALTSVVFSCSPLLGTNS